MAGAEEFLETILDDLYFVVDAVPRVPSSGAADLVEQVLAAPPRALGT